MKGSIKFIIRINPWSNSFEYSYNELRQFSDFEPEIYYSDPDDTDEYVYSELSSLILGDYMCLQLANCEDYVLGMKSFNISTKLFPSEKAVDNLYEMIFKVIYDKFGRDFRNKYDGKHHSFLFEIDYDVSDNEVKIIESKITDTIDEQ